MPNNSEIRTYDLLTIDDFRVLKELAIKEHEAFFRRNKHLREAYGNNLVAICLCQGAASHYLNPTVGVKDIDIWLFYKDCPGVNFPARSRKRDDNAYMGKPIDWLRRAIPAEMVEASDNEAGLAMRAYIEKRNINKWQLLKKAIIGLYPEQILGEIIWKGEI